MVSFSNLTVTFTVLKTCSGVQLQWKLEGVCVCEREGVCVCERVCVCEGVCEGVCAVLFQCPWIQLHVNTVESTPLTSCSVYVYCVCVYFVYFFVKSV